MRVIRISIGATLAFAAGIGAVLALGPIASAGPQQSTSSTTSTTSTTTATFTLQVQITGSGHVTSSPSGIDCPGTCSAKFSSGTHVSLSPNADTGWVFSGWGGACSGIGGCSVTMNSSQTVSATFKEVAKPTFTLTVTVAGSGTVSSSPGGIACPGTCSATYDQGTAVTLAPVAASTATFGGWSGACSGGGLCAVTVNADTSATATFNDLKQPPDQARPAPGTSTPDRSSLGGPYRLVLPFLCYSTNDLWLDALYRHALGRGIDAAALDALGARLAGGTSRTDVALLVLQSLEFRIRLVRGYYATYLKRQPTGPELASMLDLLANSRDETVQAALLGSVEYFSSRGGGTVDGFVTALYQDILGRTPSSTERTAVQSQLSQGSNREEIAFAVVQSKEARTRLVQGLYQDLLGRPPSQAEIDALVNRLGQGATNEAIMATILGSDEFLKGVGDYEATIGWGDGTSSPGTVQQGGERCTVVGSHTYGNDGPRTLQLVITSPDGGKATLTRSLVITPPPPPPPGKENVQPSGKVFIKIGGKFVPLTGFAQVPLGTVLDTRQGKVKLTSHDGSTGEFYEGIFRLGAETERRITFTLIVLTGGNFGVCQTSKRTVSAAGKTKPPTSVRHVWGNAKGHFRTTGKNAAATIRGTLWLTNDLCIGTRVTVRRGVVDVYDFAKRKHVFTHAGQTYLAKPKT